jgi:hypothetical protein
MLYGTSSGSRDNVQLTVRSTMPLRFVVQPSHR